MNFSLDQGDAAGELYKNEDQDRVEDIQIGLTGDETTENDQTWLTNMIWQASGLEIKWTYQGPVMSDYLMTHLHAMVFPTLFIQFWRRNKQGKTAKGLLD